MKSPLLAALCCTVLLSGCGSGLSDDVRSALGPREEPKSRVFQADQKATYEAARKAIDEMEFRFQKGGPAEGKIEALSPVGGGDEVGSSRQISMKVTLQPGPESGTEVEVSLVEILEADSTNQQGMATQTPLRDTPLYDVFFKDIQTYLQAGPK